MPTSTSSEGSSPGGPPPGAGRPAVPRWALWVTGLAALDVPLAVVLTLVRAGAGGLAAPAGVPGALSGVLSPLFLLVVATEIVGLALVQGGGLPAYLRALVVAQAALVALTPTLVHGGAAGLALTVAGSGLVAAMLVVSLQYLHRNKQVARRDLAILSLWPLAALLTAMGWFLWGFEGSAWVLAGSVIVQLAFAAVATLGARPEPTRERVAWLLRPFSIFLFLLFAFLGEFFLGALLDYQIAGPTFLQYIPFVPYSGATLTGVGTALYDGLWFGAAIMASAWFLVLLGFTMGPLVAFKAYETRERPQKIRLGLTIAAFALAAIYVPSVASSTPLIQAKWLAAVPLIGWGFGLRSGGPFQSGIFLAIVLMYVLVGVLSVLFGRKAICSVMCGAALMYQGTGMTEMRGFNQSSRVGKYFLGSRLSTAYLVTSGVALVSLFAISALSLLRWVPPVQVANGALDVAALPLPVELYFGGVWFAMFVTTPFIGSYSCATTGFCHWGALSAPFAKVGFFRLKVKDKKVCQACTTFDCAKACPVGLVDMPLYFRTKGEYRSSKCCGVGDCVGACPYGNMYHQDVRFWLLRRFRRDDPRGNGIPGGGTPLPMVRSVAATPPAVPARPPIEAKAEGTPA